MRRRDLLGVAAAAGVVGATAPYGIGSAAATATPGAPPLIPTDWASVRAQFAINPELAHLSTYVFAPHPASVRAAITQHRAGLDADPSGYLHDNGGRLDQAAAAAAAEYVGSRISDLAFTDSTTMGLGLLYSGLRLKRGDEVLTTEHEFYSTHEALRLRTQRDGISVRKVRLYTDPARTSTDEIVGNLVRAVTRRTKVVAVTWVHSGTGVKLPIRAIADALRGRGVLLCVDGVHGFGAEDVDPADLGCDFLVSGCHKWVLGPRGTGLVWGSAAGWSRFTPVIPTFDGRSIGAWLGFPGDPAPPGQAATPGGFHTFEHRWALAEAFAFHKAIGRDRIAARTRELATVLKSGLAGIRGLKLATPRSPHLSSGVVCCKVPGIDVNEAVARLRELKVVASSTPYEPSLLRFGATIINNEADVEATLRAVRTLV
ncbi:aminotransferase class V-fold PLP-dependent enzyme [Micromonospora sp. NPDC005298]|uniref:aminotransferase class V-fold PLP-dependent enzyme n=1 Tax=Micromonospora sp. NPDC005298 TaxID=3156873 RepID=UPI0033BE92C4